MREDGWEAAAWAGGLVLRALGREDVEDGALFLEHQIWFEMRKGTGRLDSKEGVEVVRLEVEEECAMDSGASGAIPWLIFWAPNTRKECWGQRLLRMDRDGGDFFWFGQGIDASVDTKGVKDL